MTIKKIPVNPIQENCYILTDEESRECIVIDCGAFWPDECDTIAAYIREQNLHPVAHLLTHAHFDHCHGAAFLYEEYGLQPRMHGADVELYNHLNDQCLSFLGQPFEGTLPPAGATVDATTVITLGRYAITVIETPGHTPGGVCYLVASEGLLFTGDTLFYGSVGRTDFPGGSSDALMQSLRHLVDEVDGQPIAIYPGHGPSTNLAAELRANPYLRATKSPLK